jgi:hypothetical protein
MSTETERPSDLFFKYNYTETKDFCKQFLTLVVAVLVFSLTFSENVVDFSNASLAAKLCLVLAWTSMLISIVSCGVGLTYMALAGGNAVYGGMHYPVWASKSYRLIIIAGASFIIGLVLLIVAAITSVTLRPASDRKATPNQAMQRAASRSALQLGVAPELSPRSQARSRPRSLILCLVKRLRS